MPATVQYMAPRNHPQGSTLANRTMRKAKATDASKKPAVEASAPLMPPAPLRIGYQRPTSPMFKIEHAYCSTGHQNLSSSVLSRKPLPPLPGNADNMKSIAPDSSGRALAAAAGRAAMTASGDRGVLAAKQRPVLSVRTDFGTLQADRSFNKYTMKVSTLREPAVAQPDAVMAAWSKIKAGEYQEERKCATQAVIAEQKRVEAAQQGTRTPMGYKRAYHPGRSDSLGSDVYDDFSRPDSAASNHPKSSFVSFIRKTISRRGSNASMSSIGSDSSTKSASSSILGSAKKVWGYFRDLDAKDEASRNEKKRQNLKAIISRPAPDAATAKAAQAYPDLRVQQAGRSAPMQQAPVYDLGRRGTTIGDLIDPKPQAKMPSTGRAPVSSTIIGTEESELERPTERELATRNRERPIIASQSSPRPLARVASSIYSAHPRLGRQASYSSIAGNPYLETVRESRYSGI